MCINQTWVDTHPSFLHTDCGVSSPYVGSRTRMNLMGMPQHDAIQTTRSQVARRDVHTDAGMPSHTTSDQYEGQGDAPTTLLPWTWTTVKGSAWYSVRF